MKPHCNIRTGALLLGTLLVPFSWGLESTKVITQYHQDFWGEEDGLPQASVQAITQTRNGYIWIGTRDGLARFDGLKFTVYRGENQQGLLSNDIRSLYEDNLGRLWIGTFNGGVSCLENGEFRAYTSADGLTSKGVLTIYQDHYGNLWFGTWTGIVRFNRGRFDSYGPFEGVEGKSGWSFREDQKQVLWAATDRAIHQYVDGQFQADLELCGTRTRNIRKMHIDREGVFWIGTLNGLIRSENGVGTTFTTGDGLADNRVRALEEDGHGNIWVGTWDGLSRIQGKEVTSLPKSGERISGMIEALFADRDGSLWIGMRGGGLGRLRDAKFSNFTTREGLPSKIPRCVYEGRDSSVWIGTDGGGLARLNGGGVQQFSKTNGLPSDFVASVAEDQSGTIWAGLGRPAGLAAIRHGKVARVLNSADGLPFEYSVRAVFVDRENNLWTGGDGGLCRITAGRVTTISGLPSSLVRMIAQDREGNIWAGTDDGLCVIRDDQVATVYNTAEGLSDSAVYSFYQDESGAIWLGTQQGLTHLKEGRLRALTREKGGFQGTIYHVMEDAGGTLWMSSSRGISAAKRSELESVLDGRAASVEIATFGTADGLKSTQCQGGSLSPGCRTRDGRLWFAALNGVAITQPSDADPHQEPPPVLIEEIKADRRVVNTAVVREFVAGTEDFEFNYTALRFITPEKVQFKYQLVGHDKAWVPAGTRRAAYYNNLRPGAFTFRVAASSDGVRWSEPVQTAAFILLPHFYQTRWFYVLCMAVVGAAGFGVHRYRMRKAREQFSLILAERSRIARDLHDTMAQGFAGTAFQLEALRSNIEQAPPETKRHLEIALTMVRHSFTEARRAVMNLRSPMLQSTDLVSALSEVGRQMVSDTGVDLQIQSTGKPRPLGAEVEDQLLRICQEALANVLKHANASRIELSFDFSPDRPLLCIRDNGSGFDLERVGSRNGHHFGLQGMKERVEQLGGALKIKTDQGKGTEIAVYLK